MSNLSAEKSGKYLTEHLHGFVLTTTDKFDYSLALAEIEHCVDRQADRIAELERENAELRNTNQSLQTELRHQIESEGRAVLIALASKAPNEPLAMPSGPWIERWYGSEPMKGSWIYKDREPIAHFGAEHHDEVTKVVYAHNVEMAKAREYCRPQGSSQHGEDCCCQQCTAKYAERSSTETGDRYVCVNPEYKAGIQDDSEVRK